MMQINSFVYGLVLDADKMFQTPLILSGISKEQDGFKVSFYGIFYIFASRFNFNCICVTIHIKASS